MKKVSLWNMKSCTVRKSHTNTHAHTVIIHMHHLTTFWYNLQTECIAHTHMQPSTLYPGESRGLNKPFPSLSLPERRKDKWRQCKDRTEVEIVRGDTEGEISWAHWEGLRCNCYNLAQGSLIRFDMRENSHTPNTDPQKQRNKQRNKERNKQTNRQKIHVIDASRK